MHREPAERCAKRRAWIAFGANLPSETGTPIETLKAALSALKQQGHKITGISRIYETPCFPAGAGPDYVNFAAEVLTSDSPEALLQKLHVIEADLGRVRKQRWAGRPIDLDLMAMDTEICPDADTLRAWMDLPLTEQSQRAPDQLILPHPRIQDRAFMLIPFADLAPDWRHPILGKSVKEMLDARSDEEKSEVKPMSEVEIHPD